MIQGHRDIPELDALHLNQHRLLFANCLGVIEKVATVAPTADTLPVGYMQFANIGGVKSLYFNTNGAISKVAISTSVTTEITSAVASAIPSGVIAMWSGSVATIPTGWLLCNGSNGTPDLRDRFVIGAGSTYAVAAIGGAATHTLVTAEMPAHTHTQTNQNTVVFGVNAGGGPHPETAAGNTGSTGGGGAHNNLPPYYALCYIMKS